MTFFQLLSACVAVCQQNNNRNIKSLENSVSLKCHDEAVVNQHFIHEEAEKNMRIRITQKCKSWLTSCFNKDHSFHDWLIFLVNINSFLLYRIIVGVAAVWLLLCFSSAIDSQFWVSHLYSWQQCPKFQQFCINLSSYLLNVNTKIEEI